MAEAERSTQDAHRQAVLDKLRAWLVAKRPGLPAGEIAEGTDIIESRILESLQLIEFVLFIENEVGRSILAEDMDMGALRTLASIYTTYFEPEKAHGAV